MIYCTKWRSNIITMYRKKTLTKKTTGSRPVTNISPKNTRSPRTAAAPKRVATPVAAPVAGKILNEVISYLELEPTN